MTLEPIARSEPWDAPATPCPCTCTTPFLTVEYRTLVGRPSAVAGASFDAVAWGRSGAVIPGGEVSDYDYAFPFSVLQENDDPDFTTVYRTQMRITCTGNGVTYELRLRYVSVIYHLEGPPPSSPPPPTYSLYGGETTTTVSPAAGVEEVIYLEELPAAPAPATVGESSYLYPEGPLANAADAETGIGGEPLAWRGVNPVLSLRKRGFCAYFQTSGPARIFRTETASGDSPGCVSADEPAKTYSGHQTVTIATEEVSDPSSVYGIEDTLSDDAAPQKSPLAGMFATPAGRIDTATVRKLWRSFRCGTNTLQDKLTLTLSDEFTTDLLRESLGAVVDNALASYNPNAAITDPRTCSYLSPDETFFELGQATVRLKGVVYMWRPRIPPSLPPDPDTFTFTATWTKRRINRATGEYTDEEQSQDVTAVQVAGYLSVQQFYTFESDPVDVDLEEGFEIQLLGLRADVEMMVAAIRLTPAEE